MNYLLAFTLIAFGLIPDFTWSCEAGPYMVTLENSSFEKIPIKLLFSKKGYVFSMGDRDLYFDHKQNQWCNLANKSNRHKCEIEKHRGLISFNLDNFSSKALISIDKNHRRCFFVMSVNHHKQIDHAAPYLKYCDVSNLTSVPFNAQVLMEAWHRGKKKGRLLASTQAKFYDSKNASFIPFINRFPASKQPTYSSVHIYGSFYDDSTCVYRMTDEIIQ